uniref:Uncharacterized protein n=2 Tax=Denticeps clupeoides TaxID=299321 RepID=A0AAY4CCF7_9TELE
MGASMDVPASVKSQCPLCHGDCRDPATLRCRHRFCKACIGEVWSCSPSGPFYCPECRQEYRTLSDAEWTSAPPAATGWKKKLSSYGSPSSLLGKRAASSSGPHPGGHRLSSSPSRNGTFNVEDSSSDSENPPRKKAPFTTAASSGNLSASPLEGTSMRCTDPARDQPGTSVNEQQNPPEKMTTSEEGIREMSPERTSPYKVHQKSPDRPTPERPPATKVPTPHLNEESVPDLSSHAVSSLCTIRCHYCPSQRNVSAVKTCLVCGASMCPEHLQVHLESPVFQSHPLVPAVEDMSPWRCQEHQEMNRIYCRQCQVCVCTVCTVIGCHRDHTCISIKDAEKELREKMKEEMKKLQNYEKAVKTRTSELQEKRLSYLEVLEEARSNIRMQYQRIREALEQEEQQALRCVDQEEARTLMGVEEQIGQLESSLTSVQGSMDKFTGLADGTGALRAQDQAFIMEYRNIVQNVSTMSNPVEDLDPPQEVDHARLACLRDWTVTRLDSVIISLPHRDPFRLLYGITPSMDPDTAHTKLVLSRENRQVTFSETPQPYPELESRFTSFPQVLASSPLQGGCWYWEVEVPADEGRWKVGVCSGQIGRRGQKDTCRLGFNPFSWCLLSEGKGKIEALYDKESAAVCVDSSALRRVGLLLDFEEGCLSFFSVAEGGALTLLYSYQHTFHQPLYPALAASKTQLTICDIFERDSSE